MVATKPRIAIVGYGKVGRVLCRALPAVGYEITAIVTRQSDANTNGIHIVKSVADLPDSIELVILALRDSEIIKVISELPTTYGKIIATGVGEKTRTVCHTAGAISAEILAPARQTGWQIMSWHPLMTFTGDEELELFKGVTVGIDGDESAVQLGEQLARDLSGIPFRVPPELRGTYHLSAVFACNLVAALVGESLDLLGETGMSQQQALQALAPLIRATLENLIQKGLSEAITGPVRRGDVGTISKHLHILAQHSDTEAIYRALSLALLKRLPETAASTEMRKQLEEHN